MRRDPMPKRLYPVMVYTMLTLWFGVANAEGAADIGKPPPSPHVPMVRIPLTDWTYATEVLPSSLGKCVAGRPLCETGTLCFAWVQVGFEIQTTGEPRYFRTLSSCLLDPSPPVPWSDLLGLRYNPEVRGGKTVPVRSWIVLAYPIGVSS